MFQIHRKGQFDIIKGGIKNPLLVIAWVTQNSYSRLFCLWRGGVWVRWFGKRRFCWQWGGTTKRAADERESARKIISEK